MPTQPTNPLHNRRLSDRRKRQQRYDDLATVATTVECTAEDIAKCLYIHTIGATRSPLNQLKYILAASDTSTVRFLFGLITIGFSYSLYILQPSWAGYVIFTIMPWWAWSIVFALNGVALLHGSLTGKYSGILLLCEGVLGVAAWSAVSIATTLNAGCLGYSVLASIVSLWLLIRYPTWKTH